MKKIILSIFILLSLTLFSETQVNPSSGPTYNNSESPSSAFNVRSQAVIAWNTITPRNIYTSYRSSPSSSWSSPTLVSTSQSTANKSEQPIIVLNNSGQAILIWGSRAKSSLYSSYSIDVGRSFSDPVLLSSSLHFTSAKEFIGTLNINSSGQAIVSYTNKDPGEDPKIYTRYSTNGGKTWSAPRYLADAPDFFNIKTVLNNSGQAIIAWPGKSDSKLYTSYSTDGGATFSTPNPVSTKALKNNTCSLTINNSGHAIIAYDDLNGNIFVNLSSNGGQSWQAARQINQSGLSTSNPEVVINNLGEAIVAYQYTADSHSDSDRVLSSYSKDSGKTWSTPLRVGGEDVVSLSLNDFSQAVINNRNFAVTGRGIQASFSTNGGVSWSSLTGFVPDNTSESNLNQKGQGLISWDSSGNIFEYSFVLSSSPTNKADLLFQLSRTRSRIYPQRGL